MTKKIFQLQEMTENPDSGRKVIEIGDGVMQNGGASSNEDSSDESSSSSSSGSPEPILTNGLSDHYHPRRSTDSKTMKGSVSGSKQHQGAVPKLRSRNSHQDSSDSSSSSAEEETPFLTVAEVIASRDSNKSYSEANKVTRDIGVQVSLEPEEKKISPRRKNKLMTKSFNVQAQSIDQSSNGSRSKSAGVY
jgi:hypothetical protein